MARVEVTTKIDAPPEVCFDLARDMQVHERSTASTGERVVEILRGGTSISTASLLEFGDIVTFEAKHFGIRQRLTSKIVAYDRPSEFVDEMQQGAFRRLKHVHRFEASEEGTKMTDILEFESPGWILGRMVDRLILAGYMRRFLAARGGELEKLAETGQEFRPHSC